MEKHIWKSGLAVLVGTLAALYGIAALYTADREGAGILGTIRVWNESGNHDPAADPFPNTEAAGTASTTVADPGSQDATSPPVPSVSTTALSVRSTWTETATRDHFNGAFRLRWSKRFGDWTGPALGTATISDLDTEQVIRIPLDGASKDFAVVRSGGTTVSMHSREATEARVRPALIVNDTVRCGATRDVSMDGSTAYSLGRQATLATRNGFFIAFDDCAVREGDSLVLELTTTKAQYGTQTVTVYAAAPSLQKPPAVPGITYGGENDVVLRVSGNAWRDRAIKGSWMADRNMILPNGDLRVTIPTGKDTGSVSVYVIPKEQRQEQMFLRYTMTVANDWWVDTGGKWPGLANTGMGDAAPAQAGWGGRLADGTRWSARLQRQVHGEDPFAAGFMNVLPYVYRVNKVTFNGDGAASNGVFARGKAVTIDQMVRVNSISADGTPQADGMVAVWMNGELVSVMDEIIFRTNSKPETLPSEVWLNTYEGGTGIKAPHPMSVVYGPVTVSTKLLPL
jgi:hypothetical protein